MVKDRVNYLLPCLVTDEIVMYAESDVYVSKNPFTRQVEDHASYVELNTPILQLFGQRAKYMDLTSAIKFTARKMIDLPTINCVSI